MQERAGTIGFRCVADAADNCTYPCLTESEVQSSSVTNLSSTVYGSTANRKILDWVHVGNFSAGYSETKGLNCYAGHGAAADIDNSSTAAMLTTPACQKHCDDDPACFCFVQKTVQSGKTAKCYRRSTCDITKCSKGGDWNTYTKSNSGSMKVQPPWFLERKAGGTGVLTPTLVGGPSATSVKGYQQGAPAFVWSDGSPDVNSDTPLSSGVFAATGSFQLKVPAATGSAVDGGKTERQLKLLVGCYRTTCKLAIKTSDGIQVSSKPVEAKGGTKNMVFSLVFTGSLEATWGRDADGEEEEGGNITFQAAILEG